MKIRLLCLAGFVAASYAALSQQNEIPESGNVGIGTTAPTAKLDVRGDARIDSTLKVGDSLIIMNSARVGDDLKVSGNAFIEGDLQVLGLSELNATVITGALGLPGLNTADHITGVLVLDENGKVQKMDGLQLGTLPYKPFTICDLANPHPTWSSEIGKIYSFCPDVRVGIGTNSPEYLLDVRGSGYFKSGLQVGNVQASSFPAAALIEGERTDASNAPLMRLSVKPANGAAQTRFKVEKDGRVYCTSVYVRPTAAIPDYVFRPGYRLMPLEEIKAFVQTNEHLPNVPGEAEINENGLSVDEMQLRLLEKVEELTLYVIELHEANKARNLENVRLRAELEELKVQISRQ
jgi:hypothetical protein